MTSKTSLTIARHAANGDDLSERNLIKTIGYAEAQRLIALACNDRAYDKAMAEAEATEEAEDARLIALADAQVDAPWIALEAALA